MFLNGVTFVNLQIHECLIYQDRNQFRDGLDISTGGFENDESSAEKLQKAHYITSFHLSDPNFRPEPDRYKLTSPVLYLPRSIDASQNPECLLTFDLSSIVPEKRRKHVFDHAKFYTVLKEDTSWLGSPPYP
jgi:hypothetical protein